MLPYELFDLIQVSCPKSVIGCQTDRLKPELGLILCGFYMNMSRLLASLL